MPENLPEDSDTYTPPEVKTPPEIITQTDTTEKPPLKIEVPTKPGVGPEPLSKPETEKPVEQKPPIDPAGELERAKEELKKMWVPEDIKERKDLLEENTPAPASEPKLEIVENIGRRKTGEEIAENKKIKEEQEKEKDIKEKQQRGEILSTGDFVFIKGIENRRELSRMAEKSEKEGTEKSVPEKESKEVELGSTQIDTTNVGEVSEKFSDRTKEIEKSEQETPEQLAEKEKASEELRQKQIETAKLELEEQLKIINEAREKKDATTELSTFKKAEISFEIAEGRSLIKEAIQRADVEIKQENLVRMSPEQYKQKFTKRAEGFAEAITKSDILEKRLAMLSDQEKAQYTGEDGMNKFSVDMGKKVDSKIEELKERGIVISQNAFYAMMEKGLNPEQIKVGGWFSKKVKISHVPMFTGGKANTEKLSINNFLKMAEELEKDFVSSTKKQAEAELEREIKRGQDLWKAKKYKCVRDVIYDKVEEYKKQKEEVARQHEIEEQNKIKEKADQEELEKEKSKKKKPVKKRTAKKTPNKKVAKKGK